MAEETPGESNVPEGEEWLREATADIQMSYLMLIWNDETEDWEIDTNLSDVPEIAAALSRVLFRMAVNDIQWDERDADAA